MGRREARRLLKSTWSVYEPSVPGTPFRKKALADASAADTVPGRPSPVPPAVILGDDK